MIVHHGLDQEATTSYRGGLPVPEKQFEDRGSNTDVRLAHLIASSLRDKIEELTQFLCIFEILEITETYLDKEISDVDIDIPGIKFIRLADTKDRKDGGYILHQHAEHLQVIRRKRFIYTRLVTGDMVVISKDKLDDQ